ncbi:MAG: 2-amino-4-hydroxy-6-hydroxymethyldihydropteridine diphosphokinase [Endomicrobium sp.]|jgi:2-amino-4-hydroxy-6-hydroxymethyldihydropteridine diphosphokinase|nr:2-amino-4-hydroxy-6-hydroxymethyldihydropteridine diphosphokinase [Endomicrobium sp.]
MKNSIYLSLGSNVGNRMENITSALSFLQSSGFVNIEKISSFYETSPVGPKQRSFYNIVIKARTNLSPYNLFILIKQAECILGRRKTIKWGPRVIDIDILFFNSRIIKEDIKDIKSSSLSVIPKSFNRNVIIEQLKVQKKMGTLQRHPVMANIGSSNFVKKGSNRKNLIIPHIEIQNRLFILIPLCEVAKNFIHPVFKQKISSILYDKSLTLKYQKVKII